ncbi:MAG: GntR family transcriptional regulator [Candidatus Aminicenantes bacterium]|jgi:GntR family transcriptional regulator
MFIVIAPQNPDPMYKQVTDQIKDAIASGTLIPETKLPSIREMAKELKISMITIKRAYADLENEGYILTRSGLGSFVVDINREKLRDEKLAEIRTELTKILNAAARYDISADDIFTALRGKGVK